MNILVNDDGFHNEDWKFGFHAPEQALAKAKSGAPAVAMDINTAFDLSVLSPCLDQIDLIRINFASPSDGRIYSQARKLRNLGFAGRLRAFGPLVVDQYSAARRAGFDEVEINAGHARRQPETQWLAQQSDMQTYQTRLRQFD